MNCRGLCYINIWAYSTRRTMSEDQSHFNYVFQRAHNKSLANLKKSSVEKLIIFVRCIAMVLVGLCSL